MRGFRFIKMMTPLTVGREQVWLPVGKLAFLIMYITGTNTAAVAMADFGRLRLTRNGEDSINTDIAFLHDLTDLKGGFPALTTPAIGAMHASLKIPRALDGLPNVMDIRDVQEAYLDIDWNEVALAADMSALSVYLYGFYVPEAVERYELLIHDQDMYAGAAATLTERMSGENIAAILCKVATPANLTGLQILVDNEPVWDGDDNHLTAITNILNRVESAGTWNEIILTASGNPLMSIGKDVQIKAVFGATDTLSIRKMSIKPSSVEKIRSSIVHAEIETERQVLKLPSGEKKAQAQMMANVPAVIQSPVHARTIITGLTRIIQAQVRRPAGRPAPGSEL